VSVCPCTKRKTASVINMKVVRDIVHGRPLACIDPEVKRSKSGIELWSGLTWGRAWVFISMRLHIFQVGDILLLGKRPSHRHPEHGWKHCLIMDEVDGMSGNEDRGGIQVSHSLYLCCSWLPSSLKVLESDSCP